MIIFVPILSAAAWLTIEVMVLLNLSDTIPLGALNLLDWTCFIVSAVVAFILPFFISRQAGKQRFFFSFFLSLVALLFLAGVFGRHYHRDFDSFGFQVVLLFYVLIVLKLDSLKIVKQKHAVYRSISIITIVVFILWTAWLMMMAYAIVTRAEPRWIESTAYNLLNILISFMMIASAVYIWEKVKRRLHFKQGKLYLDERDISSMLSLQECSFIRVFLSADTNTLNCNELYIQIKNEDLLKPQCEQCKKEMWTATSCGTYRNYKNRINEVKKYLELLQIGTIVPVSENPRDIKITGWRLRLFDDIHYHPTRM
ncbi:MAG: hypothetical protein JEZ04_12345 [Spirochaetales bacterium]|nr:hypothetical protein [Spirochaetales bacterium]